MRFIGINYKRSRSSNAPPQSDANHVLNSKKRAVLLMACGGMYGKVSVKESATVDDFLLRP